METLPRKHYLVASDFDQTLSFNDSGLVLAELIGVSRFEQKVDGLARSNLVQQGGELAYLIRHDPEFRGVRREHLAEAGRRVRLRSNIPALVDFLQRGLEDCSFSFCVVSAAPREVILSALEGVVSPEHIFGTEFEYDAESGEVESIVRVPAGYGKVAVVEELESRLGIAPGRTIYIGDGSSDVHVMLREQPGWLHHRGVREHAARASPGAPCSATTFFGDGADPQAGAGLACCRSAPVQSNGLTLHEWGRRAPIA